MKWLKTTVLATYCLLIGCAARAQTKAIDNFVHKKWPTLKDIQYGTTACVVDPHGHHFAYRYGPEGGTDTIVVASVSNGNIIKMPCSTRASESGIVQFDRSASKVGFITIGDTLQIFDLKSRNPLLRVADVDNFQLVEDGNSSSIAVNHKEWAVTINSLSNGKNKRFPEQRLTGISEDGKTIFLSGVKGITMISLPELNVSEIYSGQNYGIEMDPVSKDLWFLTSNGKDADAIVHYQHSTNRLDTVLSSTSYEIFNGFKFMPNELQVVGDVLIFQVKEHKVIEPTINLSNTNWKIWSSSGRDVDEDFSLELSWTYSYNIRSRKLRKLYNQTEAPVGDSKDMARKGFVITSQGLNDKQNPNIIIRIYYLDSNRSTIVSTLNKALINPDFEVSPGGKFIFWASTDKFQYFTYEVATGKVNSLADSRFSFFDKDNDIPNRRHPFGVAGWSKKDDAVFIYDKFDIWKLDPRGFKQPINVTGGEGAKYNTVLRVVSGKSLNTEVIVSAFNVETKMNGFMKLNLRRPFLLEKENLGSFGYSGNNSYGAMGYHLINYVPVKLGSSDKYIVRRESATESANLFLTGDFRSYKPITGIHPEENYQWYKNELITWSLRDGKVTEKGILYYPEDLDSTKKYPLIVHYYEKKSDELNLFKIPEPSYGDTNIPWYTSNDYIVFVPDIRNETSRIKENLKFTVTNALNELAKIKWIDTAKVGLQGHSNGGFETFLLISQLNFKAAQISAGISNLAGYFNHFFGSKTRQELVQYGQTNIGVTPWEDPTAFIRNSPNFYVDNIHTPLLMMHGTADDNVPLSHSKEMYAALRLLRKPCWLLMYEGAGHLLGKIEDRLDFTQKQQEFFGYYLKGESKPEWLR